MRHMINGRVVELFTQAEDGSVQVDDLRAAADISNDRELILQLSDGSNRIVNPGENLRLSPDQFFRDAPRHIRGFIAANLLRQPTVNHKGA